MCGICCLLKCSNITDFTDLINCIQNGQISHRGPNFSSTKTVPASDTHDLILQGHVLHLRGELTPQPLQDDKGNILLWNGEVFGGLQVGDRENDTQVLLEMLAKDVSTQHILSTMASIQGPWSFIYWQKATEELFFGRDMFGRRSLLWHLPKDVTDVIILSSVRLQDYDFVEVPSVGIFSVRVKNCSATLTMYPREGAVWPGTTTQVKSSDPAQICIPDDLPTNFKFEFDRTLCVPMSIPKLNKSVPDITPPCEGFLSVENINKNIDIDKQREKEIVSNSENSGASGTRNGENIDDPKMFLKNILLTDSVMDTLSDQLIDVLLKAVSARVYNQVDLVPNVRPCQSCQRKDMVGHRKRNDSSHDNKTSIHQCGIDRLSVEDDGCNENRSLDGSAQNCNVLGSDTFRTQQENSIDDKTFMTKGIEYSIKDNNSTSMEDKGTIIIPEPINGRAKVAVLFSGGIDSAVITALVDRCLPEHEPVDLLNVAFEQQVKTQQRRKGERCQRQQPEINWNVPDRMTGYTALKELNPNRTWNFVEVNVTIKELQEIRLNHIQHLLYPLETVLDDSIGCAVWFAARGKGIMGNTANIGKSYQSTAKVILCGMGADEQLAGYSRHRVKFMEYGWQGLLDEIELEVNRISSRNLGRDDRIITDHGKESRFPFLDENVVQFLQELQIQYKANLGLPRGIGEKLLLRLCAVKLGLFNTATFPKRAIQFGSRIAKTENNKEKGSDKCDRLKLN